MATTNNITATVNGVIFSGLTIEQAKTLASMGGETSKPSKPSKPSKTRKQAKAEKGEKSHIKIRANVVRMAETAKDKAAKMGVTLKLETLESYNVTKDGDCNWAWLRCTNDKLSHDNGKAIADKLPKGWNYSPRRNAIYRKYEYNIRIS